MSKSCKSLHFVGVGGIGMSALAQMSAALGLATTGSDRAAASPENARIFNALKAQSVQIYPQDGSVYAAHTPDALVYSTAIEEDNPDFANAPAGTPRLHRSDALKYLVESVQAENMIAVAGTCGKTSVTAQLSEALYHLGANPGVICGGLVNTFVSDTLAGNFRAGNGKIFVVEADESDKSLLNYTADTAVILNIGTDHYPKDVLADVFRQFIRNTRRNIVLASSVLAAVGTEVCNGKNVLVFRDSTDPVPEGFPCVELDSYHTGCGGAFCAFDGHPEHAMRAPGHHNALNTLAVYAVLIQMGYKKNAACQAATDFHGVWRRFDLAGRMANGCPVYDDYAHNPEKIISCLEAAKSISCGPVVLLFQPHGFKPFGDMRNTLFEMLEEKLEDGDIFGILPVYYAGGTSSFKPSACEVTADYRKRARSPEHYLCFADRTEAETFLKENLTGCETVVIMGARDNSLSVWAESLTKSKIQ